VRPSALAVAAALALLAAACRSDSRAAGASAAIAPGAPRAAAPADPWSREFVPPETLATPRVRLEPLAPRHAELDFASLMSSREHLRRTLHWGEWPRADFTLEENRADLERHWKEFEAREAYAYTVLAPDRSRCVGCVYLRPLGHAAPAELPATGLAYWVVEPEIASDLDVHLLESLLAWFQRDWPLETVAVAVHAENERGARIASRLGLVEDPARRRRPGERLFVARLRS
jgi:RimJ/RimL family protein N-acetyltransferase